MALEMQDRAPHLANPVPVAIRLRPPEREGLAERFGPTGG